MGQRASELTQGLLLEDQEAGIQELQILVEVVQLWPRCQSLACCLQRTVSSSRTYVVQDYQRLSPTAVDFANGVEQAMPVDGRNELLSEQGQENATDQSEHQVVDDGNGLELEGWSIPHQFPSTEYDRVIYDNKDRRLLQGRHGRLAGDEFEVIGRVAHDQLEGLVEDGP